MALLIRQLLTCAAAYIVGLVLAAGAMLGVVDLNTVTLDGGLPTVAMLTPMLAVVGFWAVARIGGIAIDPMRTFLFGGIAVYSLLYASGRLVANAFMSNQSALFLFAITLFALAFWMIRASKSTEMS